MTRTRVPDSFRRESGQGLLMGHWLFLDDEFVPPDLARVPASDAGLLHGAGLFETMRAHNGVVFRLRQHLDRLRNSAEALHLTLPENLDRAPQIISELLQRNDQREARVRLTVTPGHCERSSPLLIIATQPYEPYPDELYESGMTVLVTDRRQTPYDASCAHKTLSYYNRLLALREAAQRSCHEALWFTYEGRLAEGSVSNVFLVKDSSLLTAPLDTPILPGITRATVLEIAAHRGRALQERSLAIDDLLDADEVFLTNVIMKVMPVCRIEAKEVGDGKPGPVTREIARAYDELVEKECAHGGPK
ncbi:MAG: aminotransferase class IV [Phycisphaerales bacterium]|nr:MAG: aminotransferase class IV [Phycisphaerales bacterium]